MNNNYDDLTNYFSDIQSTSSTTGTFSVDPLDFTLTCFLLLLLWISYLLLPRGLRVQYFGAYPKRYAWSERMKRRRKHWIYGITTTINDGSQLQSQKSDLPVNHVANSAALEFPHDSKLVVCNPDSFLESDSYLRRDKILWGNDEPSPKVDVEECIQGPICNSNENIEVDDEIIDFNSDKHVDSFSNSNNNGVSNDQNIQKRENVSKSTSRSSIDNFTQPFTSSTSIFNDEIVISSTMQRLRDSGILVIAHGSRGKPKTVRVQLDENAIMWHSEGRKRKSNKQPKEHRVPLSHIMYVDVGKQTTALRRVENASVPDSVCLSLLTREGSLDLEVGSTGERDALVGCFSLVLDEVHAKNWRDVYRAPSSDLPSSFDEFDVNAEGGVGIKIEKNIYMWGDK